MWALDVDPLERHLVTGSADPEFRVFTISENEVSLSHKLSDYVIWWLF